jgi:hypothetical protein
MTSANYGDRIGIVPVKLTPVEEKGGKVVDEAQVGRVVGIEDRGQVVAIPDGLVDEPHDSLSVLRQIGCTDQRERPVGVRPNLGGPPGEQSLEAAGALGLASEERPRNTSQSTEGKQIVVHLVSLLLKRMFG